MLNNKKTKLFLLMTLVILLISIIIVLILKNRVYIAKEIEVKNFDIESLKADLEKIDSLNLDIILNNDNTYYNSKENVYYYYIDISNLGKYVTIDTKIFAEDKLNYLVLDQSYKYENTYYVDFEEKIDILLFNDDFYYETAIKFTCIPILNISTDEEITLENSKADIELYGDNSYITSGSNIRLRGSSSLRYPKKSYKITLTNGVNKISKSLLGMRNDEEWILEAMYADFSKVRSKLALEIWNQLNSYETELEINNDVHSEYVDLYINDEYLGLYLLKEPVDEKTLGLTETTNADSGILIKGISYAIIDSSVYEINKKSDIVAPFEMKYPFEKKDYSEYWDRIIGKFYNYYYDIKKIDNEYLHENFEMDNFVDYKILVNVIMAADNLSTKNVYLSLNDMSNESKIIFTPWDLDMSFGLDWSGELPLLLKEQFDNYQATGYIFEKTSKEVNILIKNRYFELRKTVLSLGNINSLIDSYYSKIRYSVYRDSEIWIETDLEKEIQKVKDWYQKRVEVLDEYLGDYNV